MKFFFICIISIDKKLMEKTFLKGWTIRYPGRGGVRSKKKKFMQEIELEKKIPACA